MGRSKPWLVVLLTVLVAMTVGFGKLEHHRRWAARSVAREGTNGEGGGPATFGTTGSQPDPVSEFLIDLVSPDSDDAATEQAEASPPAPLPRIRELPPLPEAYWPAPRPPLAPARPPTATAANR